MEVFPGPICEGWKFQEAKASGVCPAHWLLQRLALILELEPPPSASWPLT